MIPGDASKHGRQCSPARNEVNCNNSVARSLVRYSHVSPPRNHRLVYDTIPSSMKVPLTC